MQKTTQYPHNENPLFSKFRQTSGYLDEPSMDFVALKQRITNTVRVARVSDVDLSHDSTGG